jgi:hypothetical protein
LTVVVSAHQTASMAVDVALRLLARASEASSAPSGEAAGSNSDSQSQNQAALSLSALAESMQARAREIEAFYHQNDHGAFAFSKYVYLPPIFNSCLASSR